MSRVLKRGRCPSCASIGKDKAADNLAIYDDGGEHCWSCGYHKNGNAFKSYLKANGDLITDEVVSNPYPSDVTSVIPFKALEWLGYYHLTYRDIVKHGILWSEYRQLLVFPVGDCWQGRYFGEDPAHPKWFTKGDIHEVIHGFNLTKSIILVEDIISAVRIGNIGSSVMCIFGSDVTKYLPRLRYFSSSLVWWLDFDKKEEAYKQALHAYNLGFSVKVIVTEKDPKCHTDDEIINIL